MSYAEDKNDLTPQEFAEGFKNSSNAILLDVRTPEEYAGGHLPGAINIDIRGYEFHEKIEELDPSNTYFVYCHAGGRSNAACEFMRSKHFSKVHNMLGGILAWDGETE
ncbi:MAG: rhodanese-like domain-containing protein [Bacteroidetes bacterium]|nr:rhodanese-like domain-containing protein [Bacteroidota bacterium]